MRFQPHPPLSEGPGAWTNATFESPRGRLESYVRVESAGEVTLALTCAVGIMCDAVLPLTRQLVDIPSTGVAHIVRDVMFDTKRR